MTGTLFRVDSNERGGLLVGVRPGLVKRERERGAGQFSRTDVCRRRQSLATSNDIADSCQRRLFTDGENGEHEMGSVSPGAVRFTVPCLETKRMFARAYLGQDFPGHPTAHIPTHIADFRYAEITTLWNRQSGYCILLVKDHMTDRLPVFEVVPSRLSSVTNN
jgi:hypothetical protein